MFNSLSINENYILSLVITVYNKENYLSLCLDSVLNQKEVDSSTYEIIVVNDGSTDKSLEIIERYALVHSNVHYISQSNQGLSMARNNGLKFAHGEYVWFIDADDTISAQSIAHLIKAAKSLPDVITIQAKTDGMDYIRNKIPAIVQTGLDVICTGKFQYCAPFYIFRKLFLEKYDLKFYPGIYHEDAEFTPRMLYYAKKVFVIDVVLYYVFRDANSITQQPKVKRAYDYLFVAESQYRFSKDNIREKRYHKVFYYRIAECINNALNIMCFFSINEQKSFNDTLHKKKFLLKAFKKSTIKHKIEYYLFILFPKHYIGIYKHFKV